MYQRILVPVDGSATSNSGLAEAIRLAQLTRGRLLLLHVVDELSLGYGISTYSGLAGDWLTLLRQTGVEVLEAGKATATQAGVEVDTVLNDSFAGSLPDMVQAEAARWQADVIVLGTHGRRGISRLMLGSDAEKIIRSARVPVLLLRTPEARAPLDSPPAEGTLVRAQSANRSAGD